MNYIKVLTELIDNVKASLEERPSDLRELYEHFGLDTKISGFSTSFVIDFIYKEINEIISKNQNSKLEKETLKNIKKDFLLNYFIFGNNLEPYYSIISTILDASRQTKDFICPFENVSEWKKVISFSKDFNILSPNTFQPIYEALNKFYPRYFNLAKAAKYLIDKGYKIDVINGDTIIRETDALKVCNEIETNIKILGGINVAQNIFRIISEKPEYYPFNPDLKRFYITRALSISIQLPSVPYGYLLNLCVKYPEPNTIISLNEKTLYESIIYDSLYFCSIAYDSQPYNQFETEFKTTNDFFEFIKEITIFDNIFTYNQLTPSYVPRIIEGLFKWSDNEEFKEKLGFDIEFILDIIKRIIDYSSKKNPYYPLVIDDARLYKDDEIYPLEKITLVLNFLSHEKNEVNKDYNLPNDFTSVNFPFKPLIKLSTHQYLLMNLPWCSSSFFEAIMGYLRDYQKKANSDKRISKTLRDSNLTKIDFEQEIGYGIESFLKNELEKKLINNCTGIYKINQIDGECDIVIEGTETIVFIEIKKKVLTRKSKSGSYNELILDLTGSLLDSQVQLGQHESLIRENTYLELNNNGIFKRVDLQGRGIERVSLTQLDFGGFQDRTVIFQLLTIMMSSKMSSTDAVFKKKIDEKILPQMKLLFEYNNKIRKVDKNIDKFPFINCWFLSLPQMLMLIDDSSDTESFIKNLKLTRHGSYKSLDFYYEYDLIKKLMSTEPN